MTKPNAKTKTKSTARKAAPRRSVASLDVKPIAPAKGMLDEKTPTDFTWASSMLQSGHRVKRKAWTGNKFLDASHTTGKISLASEDIQATDWVVI